MDSGDCAGLCREHSFAHVDQCAHVLSGKSELKNQLTLLYDVPPSAPDRRPCCQHRNIEMEERQASSRYRAPFRSSRSIVKTNTRSPSCTSIKDIRHAIEDSVKGACDLFVERTRLASKYKSLRSRVSVCSVWTLLTSRRYLFTHKPFCIVARLMVVLEINCARQA
jgi:hypothetical protein